ncbi:MAG TPA: hypothetical protein VGL32_13780, partial [Acidimicrobiales bacterium]
MGSEPDQAAGLDGHLEWPGEPEGRPMAPRRPAAANAEGGEEGRTAGAARSPLSADVFTTFDELRDREGRLARDMHDLRGESHALEREMEELHKVTEELRHAVDGLDATVNESNERLEAQLEQLTREVQALRRRIPLQAARPPGIGPEQVEAVAAAVAEALAAPGATTVRAMVPLTARLRAGADHAGTGNRTAAVAVALPVAPGPVGRRLADVAAAL